MLQRWFGRQAEANSTAPTARGPAGKRCYVIGDVHGRLDLLENLLNQIEAHTAQAPPAETIVVLLGDLIDRGPDSAGVVRLARTGVPFVSKLVVLTGNHEDMLVRGLRGEYDLLSGWLAVGGDACVRSYGGQVGGLLGLSTGEVAERLAQIIPPEDLAYMAGLPSSARFGDYLLVHAGIRPGVALTQQTAHDMRWIREPFLSSTRDHGCVVVHGHSVALEIEQRGNRIGIDTGAYQTDVLTALWIYEGQRGFLQTSPQMVEERGKAPAA
jgi:serine/threonine protein phosphatase 1